MALNHDKSDLLCEQMSPTDFSLEHFSFFFFHYSIKCQFCADFNYKFSQRNKENIQLSKRMNKEGTKKHTQIQTLKIATTRPVSNEHLLPLNSVDTKEQLPYRTVKLSRMEAEWL